jgi:hypothetical protein
MLRITQKQLDVFNDLADHRFEARLASTIKKALPEAVAHLDQRDAATGLLALIRTARERAATYNIVEGADVAVFSAFLVAASASDNDGKTRFREWVVPFLERKGSPGPVKLALAEQMLRRKAASDAYAGWLCSLVETVRKSF